MKKYLLVITRANRAERPSETVLEVIRQQTAQAAKAGLLGAQENHASDSFLVVETQNDITLEILRLTTTPRYFPIMPKASEGFAVYKYDFDGGTGDIRQENGAEIQVQWHGNDDFSNTSYNTLAEAQAAIAAFHPSDGYILIHQLGSESEVMQTRPCLWKGDFSQPITTPQENALGRTDQDRY